MSSKTIVFFGYFDQTAPRCFTLVEEYEKAGFNVIHCNVDVKGFWGKSKALKERFTKVTNGQKIDAVLVMFPGHYMVLLAKRLAKVVSATVIFDAFISLYDTDVIDRARYSRFSPHAWFLYLVDFISCHLADEILIDTEEHRKYFMKMFKLAPTRIRVLYLGARRDLFYPDSSLQKPSDHFDVFFYGTYIPLQGIEHIIHSAKMIEGSHPAIRFTLVGSGQTEKEMHELAARLQTKNIAFEKSIPFAELPARINAAHLCLGIFGTTPKAQRVIPHKVYDAVACSVPVITQRSPAILERFTDGKEVILCEAGNSEDLARKIIECYEQVHISR